MVFAYIIVGGIIFAFLQKALTKKSPKFGWYIFLIGYLIVSAVCIYFFSGDLTKFTTWQKGIIISVFIVSTILRLFYYRGRLLPDRK